MSGVDDTQPPLSEPAVTELAEGAEDLLAFARQLLADRQDARLATHYGNDSLIEGTGSAGGSSQWSRQPGLAATAAEVPFSGEPNDNLFRTAAGGSSSKPVKQLLGDFWKTIEDLPQVHFLGNRNGVLSGNEQATGNHVAEHAASAIPSASLLSTSASRESSQQDEHAHFDYDVGGEHLRHEQPFAALATSTPQIGSFSILHSSDLTNTSLTLGAIPTTPYIDVSAGVGARVVHASTTTNDITQSVGPLTEASPHLSVGNLISGHDHTPATALPVLEESLATSVHLSSLTDPAALEPVNWSAHQSGVYDLTLGSMSTMVADAALSQPPAVTMQQDAGANNTSNKVPEATTDCNLTHAPSSATEGTFEPNLDSPHSSGQVASGDEGLSQAPDPKSTASVETNVPVTQEGVAALVEPQLVEAQPNIPESASTTTQPLNAPTADDLRISAPLETNSPPDEQIPPSSVGASDHALHITAGGLEPVGSSEVSVHIDDDVWRLFDHEQGPAQAIAALLERQDAEPMLHTLAQAAAATTAELPTSVGRGAAETVMGDAAATIMTPFDTVVNQSHPSGANAQDQPSANGGNSEKELLYPPASNSKDVAYTQAGDGVAPEAKALFLTLLSGTEPGTLVSEQSHVTAQPSLSAPNELQTALDSNEASASDDSHSHGYDMTTHDHHSEDYEHILQHTSDHH